MQVYRLLCVFSLCALFFVSLSCATANTYDSSALERAYWMLAYYDTVPDDIRDNYITHAQTYACEQACRHADISDEDVSTLLAYAVYRVLYVHDMKEDDAISFSASYTENAGRDTNVAPQ